MVSLSGPQSIPTAYQRIRVLVVDDHPALRRALLLRLKSEPDLEVLAEAQDGEEAVDLACRLRPDVVLMDGGLPRLGGAEATRRIRHRCPGAEAIGLSTHDAVAPHMLAAGAAAFVTKGAPLGQVVAAVRGLAPRRSGRGPRQQAVGDSLT